MRTASIAPVRIVRIGVSSTLTQTTNENRSELDSHADTCVVGSDTALITQDFDQPVRVLGYDGAIGEKENCRTVTAVIAYDHPATGESFYLHFHQAILIPRMKNNLLSPMQLRDNYLHVNDEPKHMVPNPTDDHHAICVPHWHFEESGEPFRIPLMLHGITSYFPSRKPTITEYENSSLDHHIDMTSADMPWDPMAAHYGEQEAQMIDSKGNLCKFDEHTLQRVVASMSSYQPEEDFGIALQGTVKGKANSPINSHTKRKLHSIKISKRNRISPETLVKNWGISLDSANKTLQATTMKGLRTTLHPTLSRRFRTNDRQLRYRRLSHDMYTDTAEAKVVSYFRKNKYGQIFATRFGWVRVFPMQKKSDAHHGFSSLAQRDGVPPILVMDGAKEETLGEFRRKAKEMDCRVKQTEPYSPWQNAAEGCIREVKRSSGRRMVKMKAPAKLWDHSLELHGLIRSHTATNHFDLQGQVPETILSGQTADISPFVEFGFYDWIKWWDANSAYPEPKERLGRWLGPAIDVGPALTAKVLKSNGQVIYVSTYRALTDDELASPIEAKEREAYDNQIKTKLGNPLTAADLEEYDADTPDFSLYEDDVNPPSNPIPDIDDVTPEDYDQYIGAVVNFSLEGSEMAGSVKRRARDNNGKLYGKQHNNPILDIRS